MTITSMPRDFANSTSANAVVPQSTVMRRLAPDPAKLPECRLVEPVSVGEPVRQVRDRTGSERSNGLAQDGGARDPVDVEVPVDRHRSAATSGVKEHLNGPVHARHREWIDPHPFVD